MNMTTNANASASIDDEWTQYMMSINNPTMATKATVTMTTAFVPRLDAELDDDDGEFSSASKTVVAKPFELFISTTTKVLFLNQTIDIQEVFWNIPITEYWEPRPGVMKKQIKIVSKNVEEFEKYKLRLETVPYYNETILKQINNPAARSIKFKDERKITIGISKKDIMNCRIRTKNAFYNCFAIIMRFLYEDEFREIHVKVFNTGKMEIPGILNSRLLDIVKKMVLEVLAPHLTVPPDFAENKMYDSVLINSNFNCGFYIQREKLYNQLRTKYGIETSYDPCSYPGVKSKFYFNNAAEFNNASQTGCIKGDDPKMTMSELIANKKYTEVSFMIFRTGSCLIVGNCSESVLLFIFKFIKRILIEEKEYIYMAMDETPSKIKKLKLRKKVVSMTQSYYNTNISK